MAAVNVTFPGNLAQVQTASDLRAIPSSLIASGDLYLVNGLQGLFEYDPGSVSIDDGTDVIRPYDKTPLQAGRWIKNVDGLASGPQGETGPSNNTRLTLAALKAAAITDKTSLYDGDLWTWVLGDFSGTPSSALNKLVVKSDNQPLTVGAWLRNNDQISIRMFGAVAGQDSTAALQAAINANIGGIVIPTGEFLIGTVTGANVFIRGPGTLRKKPNTKGFLFDGTGDNRFEGVSFDYDWENCDQSNSYFNNVLVDQVGGSLTLNSCKFRRSYLAAVYVLGGSLFTDAGCQFVEGAPHNNLTAGNERVTHYIVCVADVDTFDQVISVNGGYFRGASLDPEKLHLNPTGILITSNGLDGARYRTVNINNAILDGCSTNAGNGNITGAIDTYDGAENINITGVTIKSFTYAGLKIQNSSNFVLTGCVLNGGYIPTGANTPQSLGIAMIEKARGATAEQRNGVCANNILINSTYTAISNSCDYVKITGNQIPVVQKRVVGTAIYNTGNHVSISGNMGSAIEGVHIFSSGDYVDIDGNDTESGIGAGPGASDNAVFMTGFGLKVRNNRFRSTTASPGPCIRTNGPLSAFDIMDNDINGYAVGVDLRTTSGAVDNGRVGIHRFTSVGLPFNVTSGCTNITRDYMTTQPGTVALLPTNLPPGTRGFVTDATAPVFGATVAGGGAAFAPIYFDGSAWKVG